MSLAGKKRKLKGGKAGGDKFSLALSYADDELIL